MIQDIGDGVFSNAFSSESVCEGDFLFCYRDEDILLKDNHGIWK